MIGKYNRIIALQRKTLTPDAYGGQTEAWATYATVWAAVKPLKGRELIAAQAAQSAVANRFEMRYRSDVLASDRIQFGGKNYNITAVIDVEDRREELIVMAETGLNNG